MDKKIKILYYADTLSCFYQKTSSRSGIFFAALNILKELVKRDDIEVTLFPTSSKAFMLKKFTEHYSEFNNLKILCTFTIIDYIMGYLEYYKFQCRKIDQKDNLYKKTVRFFTIRLLKIFNRIKYIDNDIKDKLPEFDIFLSPCDAPPKFIAENKNIKKFTLLHDVTPIALNDYFKEMDIATSGFKILFNSLNKEDYYFANSKYTKQDFLKYSSNLNPEHVIPLILGADERFKPETNEEKIKSIKQKYNIPLDKKTIFSLCTLEPRKNLIFAIKNFIKFIEQYNIEDLVFVMGGGHWQKFLEILNKELKNEKYKDKIIKTGYIDDEDLPVLYSACEIFVYPSIYEGFGTPVLEAMKCGCAVITSNVTSMPEVIGDTGIQINPKSDEDLIEAYRKMYFDKEFQTECRQKAFERSKQFRWDTCVEEMVKSMKNIIGEHNAI